MKGINIKIEWDENPLPKEFAEALLMEVSKIRAQTHQVIDADCSGIAVGNSPAANPVVLTYGDERYQQLYNINMVAGARSSGIGTTSFADFNDNGNEAKLLIPFQFTGIVTAPFDAAKPKGQNWFWNRILRDFVDFLMMPAALFAKSWEALRALVLKNGDAANMSYVYKGDKFLEEKKNSIDGGNNPLSPVNFLPSSAASSATDVYPSQAGLGIFIARRSQPGSIWQLTDPRRQLSPYINSQTQFGSWEIPGDVQTIIIKWMSKKAGYQYNDGECYGSFKLCKKL